MSRATCPGAVSTFQDAIKAKPDEMLAFYRLGEAEQESGHLDDADKAWEAALSKRCTQGQGCERGKGADDLKAKVLFSIAVPARAAAEVGRRQGRVAVLRRVPPGQLQDPRATRPRRRIASSRSTAGCSSRPTTAR